MKRITALLILVTLILTFTGCGGNETEGGSANSETTVGEVINEQTDIPSGNTGETTSNHSASADEENAADEMDGDRTDISDSGAKEEDVTTVGDVDYDLTAMSSEMVYALVYQMMADPDSYAGKTIRMDGLYYASYYEGTGQYYYYCIIQDATACCSQGLEFVWDDGSHVYPDEYPEEYAEVVVQGVFETYEEEGYLYCRLKDAVLEVKNS